MFRKPLFYSILITLLGCAHSGSKNAIAEKSNDSVHRIDSVHIIKHPTDSLKAKYDKDSTGAKTDSTVEDPDTVFSMHAVDIIANFPECKLAEEYLDSVTKGSRRLQLTIFGTPTKDEPYYEIDVGNTVPDGDNGEGHYETYMHFHVYNKHEHAVIKFYDIPEDKEYSLAGWRAKEDKPKKEGKKYYFFSVDEDYKY